ncbi:MarR family winged helix-turn-helix transcriptional regulator [Thalassospira sp. MCCC 1A02491]|uniref:MarR family winged helix-turn-helix transcriptional regulator n=1 Tax=Thalassospira sp. MCCC 1A02491 TaxID=1769751 RepID=UPI0007AD6EA8|nr:MarR family transcriptional regulator [Thalassospira sp. MCCC 1A02491]KZB60354.1 MarR family transcriptional regulator [Thalassospira sp. MCCC 1A02491]
MGSEQPKRKEFLDVLVALRQIIRATDLHSKHVMKVCGLTVPQLVVLLAIEELGAVTVREISRHVSLSQATVTTILNRLEERGFIVRMRNASDKRVVNSSLTDKGREVLINTPPLMDGHFMLRYEMLDLDERKQILDSLQHVARLMDTTEVDPRPPTRTDGSSPYGD